MDSQFPMNEQVYRDYAAVEYMKALIGRLPLPTLPGNEYDHQQQELIRQMNQNAFALARGTVDARRNSPW